jgi:hypothetical protein
MSIINAPWHTTPSSYEYKCHHIKDHYNNNYNTTTPV